jgi:hypothetical protein
MSSRHVGRTSQRSTEGKPHPLTLQVLQGLQKSRPIYAFFEQIAASIYALSISGSRSKSRLLRSAKRKEETGQRTRTSSRRSSEGEESGAYVANGEPQAGVSLQKGKGKAAPPADNEEEVST